jgi:hypothetical protein
MTESSPQYTAAIPAEGLPVAELLHRYTVQKPAFYGRVKALGIKFRAQGNRSYASAEQIEKLDKLHDHLQQGGTFATFDQGVKGASDIELNRVDLNYPMMAELFTRSLPPAAPPSPAQRLQDICNGGWEIDSKELCEILGLARLRGDLLHRHGFTIRRAGKRSPWWRVCPPDRLTMELLNQAIERWPFAVEAACAAWGLPVETFYKQILVREIPLSAFMAAVITRSVAIEKLKLGMPQQDTTELQDKIIHQLGEKPLMETMKTTLGSMDRVDLIATAIRVYMNKGFSAEDCHSILKEDGRYSDEELHRAFLRAASLATLE